MCQTMKSLGGDLSWLQNMGLDLSHHSTMRLG